MAPKSKAAKSKPCLNLALQGGGANGAFTWGVLDRLLEKDAFAFEGVVGTSAGAINAAALTQGLASDGPEEARRLLALVWEKLADMADMNPMKPLEQTLKTNPALKTFADFQKQLSYRVLSLFSPYQLNPFDINPLRDLLDSVLDFDLIQNQDKIKLFLNATDVETGESRIFTEMETSLDVVLASGCLPMMHQAVKVGERHYWDGGFSANPPIYPLVYGCEAPDTLLVLITPMSGKGVPKTMDTIAARLNQLTFTSHLRNELTHIRLLETLRSQGDLSGGTWEQTHLHMINAESTVETEGWESMVEVDRTQLYALRDKGREAADSFLAGHLADVGKRSTIDW
ncbi:patatin-like phospholipase family protein [Rhodovibrionaceae bacterium A322]